MKVYHGSIEKIQKPNLESSRLSTDFGKGFYTTTDYEQAKNWSYQKKRRKVKLGSDESTIKRFVNVFEYIPDLNLSYLNYEDATSDWFLFVYQNRRSEKLIHDYDIVVGPVAEDKVQRTLQFYENKEYSIKTAIEKLKTELLSNQISFHSENALKCLSYIESIEILDESDDVYV